MHTSGVWEDPLGTPSFQVKECFEESIKFSSVCSEPIDLMVERMNVADVGSSDDWNSAIVSLGRTLRSCWKMLESTRGWETALAGWISLPSS